MSQRQARESSGRRARTALQRGVVHVWRASLFATADVAAQMLQDLSTDEREQAARFRFAVHRTRFIVSRGIQRDVLSRYAGIAPNELAFSYGRHGKPALAGAARRSGLSFNVSNSGDLAVFAVCRGRAVGVDVEAIRPLHEAATIAACFFSPAANEAIAALPPADRDRALLAYWVRREATAKALGESVWGRCGSFDPCAAPEPAAVFDARGMGPEAACQLDALLLGPRYVGALATLGPDGVRVKSFEWAAPSRSSRNSTHAAS